MERPSRVWLLRLLVVLGTSFSFVGLALAQATESSSEGGGLGLVVMTMSLGVLGLLFAMTSRQGDSARPGPQARAWMNVDVTAVRIGIDARSREFMQRELGKIALNGTSQSKNLRESMGAVIRLLRKCDAAWVYGGSSNYHPMSPPIAEGVFARHADEARTKYTSRVDAMKAGEGEPVALITMVVAARREIRDFFGGRAEEISAVLDDLERLTAQELVALEVVWLPGDPDVRMTGLTLETLMPDIAKLPAPKAKKKGKPAGRVHCAYCRGPFAAELPTCPHCGAPAPADPKPE